MSKHSEVQEKVETGSKIIGRTKPKVIGMFTRFVATTRTVRVIPICLASRAQRAVYSPSTLVSDRRTSRSARITLKSIDPMMSKEPTIQILGAQWEMLVAILAGCNAAYGLIGASVVVVGGETIAENTSRGGCIE